MEYWFYSYELWFVEGLMSITIYFQDDNFEVHLIAVLVTEFYISEDMNLHVLT